MSFPEDPLNSKVEVHSASGWVDFTSRVRGESKIAITRGRSGESGAITPARCRFTLNNHDYALSRRNPTATYYNEFGINANVKVSVPTDGGSLEKYLQLYGDPSEGGWVQTSDHSSLDITGDIDVRIDITPDLTPNTQVLLSKWGVDSNQRSWAFHLDAEGYLYWSWSTSGTFATTTTVTSTAKVPVYPRRLTIRAVHDVNNGASGNTVTFYTSDSVTGTFTQLGSPVVTAGTTSIFSSSADVQVGSVMRPDLEDRETWTTYSGRVYAAQIRNGIAGTVVANPDFNDWDFDSISVVDSASRIWVFFGGQGHIGSDRMRFYGEIPNFYPKGDTTGRDVVVGVDAYSILRRLKQGAKPLRSPTYRALTNSETIDEVVAYWPFEDETESSQVASALSSGSPMSIINAGGVSFASDAGSFIGSASLPVTTGGQFLGVIPSFTFTNKFGARGLMKIPEDGLSVTNAALIDVFCVAGGIRTFRVRYDGASSAVKFECYNSADVLVDSDTFFFDLNGKPLFYVLNLTQDGADIDYDFFAYELSATSLDFLDGLFISGTFSGQTLTRPDFIVIGNGGNLEDTVVGHWTITSETTTFALDDTYQALIGYKGETAAARFQRLCNEENIGSRVYGIFEDTQLVGVQRNATFVELLQDTVDADQGLFVEAREQPDLIFVTRTWLYNRIPVDLSYASHHFSYELNPVDDDQFVRNDSTVNRYLGSSARFALDDFSSMSVTDPPVGIGTYDEEITLNLENDDQLQAMAEWRVHTGTVDENRYPQIVINLERSPFVSGAGGLILSDYARSRDVGEMINITDLPTWQQPDDSLQLVQGYTETLWNFGWELSWNATPGSPYVLNELDSGVLGRVDTEGSKLSSALNSSATTFEVTTTVEPLWTTDDAEFAQNDFVITVGGEDILVTDIAASTITYVAAGTVSHGNNASVTPGVPAGYASGDLLLIFAAIRNSGTGSVNVPSGWTRMSGFLATDNCAILGKIATSSESSPTVTFSGGVANADTSAQMIALRGRFAPITDLSPVQRGASCLNDSAQNITYPGMTVEQDNSVVIYLGWKQDDWTSVATISGATEIGEPSTTTGNDQGIVWDYVIQTTAAHIASGVFTVTGGAGAISRGAVIVVRATKQLFTGQRAYNGVTKSHSADEDVTLKTAFTLAL